MIFHKNRLLADNSHEITYMYLIFFEKLGRMSENLPSAAVVIVALRVKDNLKQLRCHINSFLASGDFCHLLISFSNSLDPDQDGQNVGPDLDPNRLTL